MSKRRGNSVPGFQKYTFKDFETEFPNDAACLEFLKEQRWPDGRTLCKKCGTVQKHYPVANRTCYACNICGHHIFPLVGTIFQKSTTPLTVWFFAIRVMSSTRCGVSAKQLQRETGVTYKTAWRIAKQTRKLMEENVQLAGQVEMDETYIGRAKGRGRPIQSKEKNATAVVGAVERRGKVIALATPDVKSKTLLNIVHERVLPSSLIFTDEFNGYDGIPTMTNGYEHRRIKHSAKVYVSGDVHTNTIEGFWSLTKRGISGVYHSVSRKYLQSYLDEYSFRYNHRNSSVPMFAELLAQVYRPKVERPF